MESAENKRDLNTLYPNNPYQAPRAHTDCLFLDDAVRFEARGLLVRAADFLEENQLLNASLWKRFVDQYRTHSDDPNLGWRCEYWGKMMRGAAMTYSLTRDEALMTMMKETVRDMLAAQEPDGRLSTYSEEKELTGWDLWGRKYVLLGMQYFTEVCEDGELNEQIKKSMCRQADAIMQKIGPATEGKKPITSATRNWYGLNSSSILEPMVRLYLLTNEKRYLDFCTYIVSEGGTSVFNIFETAYEDKLAPYQYPVTKAYEMMSCFEGLLEYARVTKDEKWMQAVIRLSRRVLTTDVTVIGCCGCTHELFDHSAARQTVTNYEGIMQETCVTVTWMKFCRQLLLLTGDPVYADAFERSFCNAYLGAFNTEHKVDTFIKEAIPDAVVEPLPFDSYSPLVPGVRGQKIGGLMRMEGGTYYGCCACIGAAGVGLLPGMMGMLTEEGMAINLYFPGVLTLRSPMGQAVAFRFVTDYPASGIVRIQMEMEKPETFALSLRVPSWSADTFILRNRQWQNIGAEKGKYATLRATWENGDEVILNFHMVTEILRPEGWEETGDPNAGYHVALQRGPLMLARDARLDGTVDESVTPAADANGHAILTNATAPFPYTVAYRVKGASGTKDFTVVDYASAGRTWGEDSKCAVWLPTKDYWNDNN